MCRGCRRELREPRKFHRPEERRPKSDLADPRRAVRETETSPSAAPPRNIDPSKKKVDRVVKSHPHLDRAKRGASRPYSRADRKKKAEREEPRREEGSSSRNPAACRRERIKYLIPCYYHVNKTHIKALTTL